MTALRVCLILLLLSTFWMLPPAPAAAQSETCADIGRGGRLAAYTSDPRLVQSGLSAFFNNPAQRLNDGIIGRTTRDFLIALCNEVPLPGDTDPVAGTVALAEEYGRLEAARPDWIDDLSDPATLTRIGLTTGTGFNRNSLALAGSTEMKAAVLAGQPVAACTAVAEASALTDDTLEQVQAGLTALMKADPGLPEADLSAEAGQAGPATIAALSAICSTYPGIETGDQAAAAMPGFAQIAEADADGLATLGSPDYVNWVLQAPETRLRRQVGTPDTVRALLTSYGASPNVTATPASTPPADNPPATTPASTSAPSTPARPAAPSATASTPSVCTPVDGPDPSFFALTPEDVAKLTGRTSVASLLKPVQEESFDTLDELEQAIVAAIATEIDPCTAAQIAQLVDQMGGGNRLFSLDAGEFQKLVLQPDLQAVLPAVQATVGVPAPSEDGLRTAVIAAAETVVTPLVQQDIDSIASMAAAAAEDVSPATDTAAPGFPEAEPGTITQLFGLTDTSLLILEDSVTDPELFQAIASTPFEAVSSRDVIKSTILAALMPIAQKRVESEAADSADEIMTAVKATYALSDALAAEIAKLPALSPLGDDAAESLAALSGISFPTETLMTSAIDTVSPPFDSPSRKAVLEIAPQEIPDAGAERAIVPIGAECECVARHKEHSSVYAFYPFWLANPVPEPAPTGAGADATGGGGADAAEAPALPPQPLVDFTLVERLAFFGLTLSADMSIGNEARWLEAAPTFISSAHRRLAKADLAITMKGWQELTESQQITAARNISELMVPVPQQRTTTWSGWFASLPDRFDSRQPDAVTLIFDDYATTDTETAQSVVNGLVEALDMMLSQRGQTINLAITLPLAPDAPNTPLLSELRESLLAVDGNPERVDELLVFLDRPTTKTKKSLRARVEAGFNGADRQTVLRKILPVLPPLAQQKPPRTPVAGAPPQTEAEMNFGQFRDDLAYFQDNFGGIGFWPVPGITTPPDPLVTELIGFTQAQFAVGGLLPASFEGLNTQIDGMCGIVCPNRIYVRLGIVGALGAALLVTGLSYYSRTAQIVGFRFMLVPALLLAVLAALVASAICDASATYWAAPAAVVETLFLLIVLGFNWYERGVEGPRP